MADDEDLLDWDDDDINDIEASDETDDGLDGGLRVTDAPGASAACASGARSCAIADRF